MQKIYSTGQKMLVIVLFVVANIIIARFLEKRKMHLAVVFHSVLFVAMLCAFAFYDTTNPLALLAQRLLGQQRYLKFYNTVGPIVAQADELIIALLAFEVALLFMDVFAIIIFVNSIAKIICAKKAPSVSKVSVKPYYIGTNTFVGAVSYRIYLKNCTLRC